MRALITGGSGGIGRAIASSLLSEEGRVVLLGRDESKLGAAVAELGPGASWRRADVANPGEVCDSVEAAIETVFHERRPPEAARAAVEQIPAGRLGQPDDVGATVRYLASPEASYVTGQVLHVNGGWWFGT